MMIYVGRLIFLWRPPFLLALTPLACVQTFKDFISNPPQPRDCDAAIYLANSTRVMAQSYGGGAASAPLTSSFEGSQKRSRETMTAPLSMGAVKSRTMEVGMPNPQEPFKVVGGLPSLESEGSPLFG